MNQEKILQAGKIAKQAREYAKSIIKKDMSLLEIVEKIEEKIFGLGGKPAFPTTLCINEIAAHYTPSSNEETKASGLLKIDLGVHIDGWIADTAFSIDLENNEKNKKLISASEEALKNVLKIVEKNVSTNEIGKIVQQTIENLGFSPIVNLSGHEVDNYDLHAGLTIPNIENNTNSFLKKGSYAIEPFATTGGGHVKEGKPSGIYIITNTKNVRSPIAREVLKFILKEYSTLPFCSRWVVKKFGTKAFFGLRELENAGNLHQYPSLIESSGAKVSQAEHTILIDKEGVKVTTN